MDYLIKPYEAVGEFAFGASLESVQAQHGKPFKLLEDNIMNNKTEYRSACELVYENNLLVYGSCLKSTTPILGGIEVFKNPIEELIATDPDVVQSKQYVLLPKWGVCIGGMSDKKIPEGKILIAFAHSHLPFFECFIEV